MSGNRYKTIIGAEIHVELSTDSKMFCGCKNDPFKASKPNIYTCPVCLGLPGALPVPNAKAIDWTIMLGLALNCKIGEESVFDRKHYSYPDLPKGYQISQQAKPLCYNGYVDTSYGKVRINRVHLEEDTAKLVHEKIGKERVSLIDFNRSGVPLVEIVTEPDIHSEEHAKEFLKKIRSIVRYLGVSDADMEKGSMRLEANISLAKTDKLPDYKVEVKNINSFNYYAKAVSYEIKRQSKLLDEGKTPVQETRGWDQATDTTKSQRLKESSAQYGYFPEPDIPPMDIDKEKVSKLKSSLPMLPSDYIEKLQGKGVSEDNAKLLIKSKNYAKYVLKALEKDDGSLAEEIANRVINKKINIDEVKPESVVSALKKEASETISDDSELESVIAEVIKENPSVVDDVKSGKMEAVGFLMGQVMKKTKGKADAKKASTMLRSKILA